MNSATDTDCANVRHVCECVSRRAAYLAAAGVSVLLNRIGEESVTVAVDGSVYRFHPHFHNLMTEQISQLIKPGIKVGAIKLYSECKLFKDRKKKYKNSIHIIKIKTLINISKNCKFHML